MEPNLGIYIEDSANLDAFSRLRVSQPFGLFDAQFTVRATFNWVELR
jgi:hypothetical protein